MRTARRVRRLAHRVGLRVGAPVPIGSGFHAAPPLRCACPTLGERPLVRNLVTPASQRNAPDPVAAVTRSSGDVCAVVSVCVLFGSPCSLRRDLRLHFQQAGEDWATETASCDFVTAAYLLRAGEDRDAFTMAWTSWTRPSADRRTAAMKTLEPIEADIDFTAREVAGPRGGSAARRRMQAKRNTPEGPQRRTSRDRGTAQARRQTVRAAVDVRRVPLYA